MDKQEKTCVCVCVWDGEGANKQNSKRGKCSFFKSRYMNVFPLFVKLYTHTHTVIGIRKFTLMEKYIPFKWVKAVGMVVYNLN